MLQEGTWSLESLHGFSPGAPKTSKSSSIGDSINLSGVYPPVRGGGGGGGGGKMMDGWMFFLFTAFLLNHCG